jgi:dihydropteroate synthase
MGVINVTPDSFSQDGLLDTGVDTGARAEQLVSAGADILDIGGESTRPGSTPVPLDEEIRRVVPATLLVRRSVDVPLSIDTSKVEVARAALAEGADIINDVSGLRDPGMASLAAATGALLVLVHNRPVGPDEDVMEQVVADLRSLVSLARSAGVTHERLLVDPGFGFGKSWRQNLIMMRRLGELRSLSLPILIGPSRKGTIARVLGGSVTDRLEGTAALVTAAIAAGADVVRVHDVGAMVRVARMADRLAR